MSDERHLISLDIVPMQPTQKSLDQGDWIGETGSGDAAIRTPEQPVDEEIELAM